jgi:hypothetical protein
MEVDGLQKLLGTYGSLELGTNIRKRVQVLPAARRVKETAP